MSGPEERPPVLRIRKDAEKDVTFHYNREERTALRRPARPESARRSVVRRLFRGGVKPLLPIMVGVLAIVLVIRLVTRDHASGHLSGYDVGLRAYAYQDGVLASVTVAWKPRPKEAAAEAAEVSVRFSAPPDAAGSVASEPITGGKAVVRGRFAATGAQRRVVAEVAISGKALRLSAPVGKP